MKDIFSNIYLIYSMHPIMYKYIRNQKYIHYGIQINTYVCIIKIRLSVLSRNDFNTRNKLVDVKKEMEVRL